MIYLLHDRSKLFVGERAGSVVELDLVIFKIRTELSTIFTIEADVFYGRGQSMVMSWCYLRWGWSGKKSGVKRPRPAGGSGCASGGGSEVTACLETCQGRRATQYMAVLVRGSRPASLTQTFQMSRAVMGPASRFNAAYKF